MKAYYSFITELNLDITFLLDPLTWRIVDFLDIYGISGLPFILFFNTILFLFLSLRFVHDQNFFKSILISFTTGLSIYALDTSVLTLIAIAPCLQIYFANKLLLTSNQNKKFYLSIVSVLLLFHGLLLAGPMSLFCLALVYLAQCEDPNYNKKIIFQLLLFLTAFLITLFPSYETSFLDYPVDSMLSEISPLTHFGTTDFGHERKPFPIPYKYFVAQENHLNIIFLLSLTPIFLSLLSNKFDKKEESKSLQRLFIMSFALLLLRAVIREKVSFALFDSALIKSFPGLIWRPLPNLIGIISLFFGLCIILKDKKHISTIGFVITGLLSLLYSPVNKLSQLHVTDYSKLPNDISDFIEMTPSNYIIDYYKNSLGQKPSKNKYELTKDTTLNYANCSVSSNRSSGDEFLLDNNEKTKWSTKRNQKVGDFIKVVCKNSLNSSRIKLNISNFRTDFPRGFGIIFDDNEDKKISLHHWIGPIKYTNNGLAYFGPQSEVIIDLPEKITFNSIKITLTAEDKTFDWSVAELESYY